MAWNRQMDESHSSVMPACMHAVGDQMHLWYVRQGLTHKRCHLHSSNGCFDASLVNSCIAGTTSPRQHLDLPTWCCLKPSWVRTGSAYLATCYPWIADELPRCLHLTLHACTFGQSHTCMQRLSTMSARHDATVRSTISMLVVVEGG